MLGSIQLFTQKFIQFHSKIKLWCRTKLREYLIILHLQCVNLHPTYVTNTHRPVLGGAYS